LGLLKKLSPIFQDEFPAKDIQSDPAILSCSLERAIFPGDAKSSCLKMVVKQDEKKLEDYWLRMETEEGHAMQWMGEGYLLDAKAGKIVKLLAIPASGEGPVYKAEVTVPENLLTPLPEINK